MANDRIRLIYLALIAGHDGKINWYKLDRSLRVEKIDTDDLMAVIGELAREGLISRTKEEGTGNEHYAITEKGQALLEAHRNEAEGKPLK